MPKGRAAYGHERKPKVEVDGIKFMSPGEAERYLELYILLKKGIVRHITLQPKFELQPKFRKDGVMFRPIIYIADFMIEYSDNRIEIEDVKGWGGYTTPQFVLKKKMFAYRYPDHSLIILKRLGKPKVIQALKDELAGLK